MLEANLNYGRYLQRLRSSRATGFDNVSFPNRFAALFQKGDGSAWQARHGLTAETYQATFNVLVSQGYRLTNVCGYSEGTGSRFNAVWQLKDGPAWQARHGLTNDQYQATFDDLVSQGFRLVCVSGYAENGQARYAAIWEQQMAPTGKPGTAYRGVSISKLLTKWPAKDLLLCKFAVTGLMLMCVSQQSGNVGPVSIGSVGTD
jgi:hypothetical protein